MVKLVRTSMQLKCLVEGIYMIGEISQESTFNIIKFILKEIILEKEPCKS
jgi:hypothetical protein